MGTNNSEESIILVVLSLALNETGVPPFCLLVGTVFRSQWYFSTPFQCFSTGSQGHKVQYIKRIMTWLEGRKRPMHRAAKLAKTRIAEGLEKRPEEMALCVQSSELLKCGVHSLEFKLRSRKSQLWTVVRRSQKRRRWCRWVSFHFGAMAHGLSWQDWLLRGVTCSATQSPLLRKGCCVLCTHPGTLSHF